METTRLSLRISRAWSSGTEFTIQETTDGVLLRPVARLPETDLDMVVGCLQAGNKLKKPPLFPAAIRSAVASEVMRRHDIGGY